MSEFRVYRGISAPEIREASDGPVMVGYAAVFNRYSQNLGGYVEQVDPVAFNGTLADGGNVAALVNHDPNWLLGTTDSNSLVLKSDSSGLGYAINLDSVDPDAIRAKRKAETGKLRGSSFSFRVLPDGESWSTTDQGFPLRTLRAVDLYDVGPVTFPAYKATEEQNMGVALRSLAATVNESVDKLISAAHDGNLAEYIRSIGTENQIDGEEKTQTKIEDEQSRSWAVTRYRRIS